MQSVFFCDNSPIERLQRRHFMTSQILPCGKKKRKKKRVSMCQPLSDYYYKLDSKSRARYDDKISYIGNRDPYNLQKKEFTEDVSSLPSLRYAITLST